MYMEGGFVSPSYHNYVNIRAQMNTGLFGEYSNI